MLRIEPSRAFCRDAKKLKAKHADLSKLREVVELISQNTTESRAELRRHHKMHVLSGAWEGANECHVCNVGDWLLIWTVEGNTAFLARTGSHDELLR
ncbi:MAG: type II toxin-antitoxin system YafQ family toxin [Coriobacteriia bacterium]|nr:type II toxin-antitoxin system YafQ family toxin [Coriobacteriia bacterium]MBS5479302.1 type II toxin-antitoxin system YafQ family toxin [Coriobacteriia bacterium]